jgi:ubiquinone/menaquinone biosynthesis C-methylase UbiE
MASPTGPRQWFFDIWSRFYDTALTQTLTYRPVHDTVMREIHAAKQPEQALDVGCGTGILTARLAAESVDASVVGCDFSAGMLEQAARRSSAVRWVQGDAQHLPFLDSTFDVVTCTESFHWYPDQATALGEFRRVLRPGGRLYVALVNTPNVALSEITRMGFGLLGQPLRWPTRDEMRGSVAEAGLRITCQLRVNRFPPGVVLPTILTIAERDE